MIPVSVTIETTTRCNLNCKMCFANATNTKNEPSLSIDTLTNSLTELIEMGVSSFLISGGEPTMYNHFKDLLAFFKMHHIVPGIATNGTYLTDELCRYMASMGITHNVYVSLDSDNPQVHDNIRGKECFQVICSNLSNLLSNHIQFAISFVAMDANKDSIDGMYNLAKNLGASFLNLIRFNIEGRGEINQEELSLKEGLTFKQLIEMYITKYNGIYCFGGENCILPIKFPINKLMFPDDSNLLRYIIIRANGNVQIGRASSNVIIGNLYKKSISEIISNI